MKRILCILSSTALMFVTLGGCQSQEDTIQDFSDGLSAVDAVSSISSETELFSERDLDPSYEEASAVQIELNGTEAAATGDGVQISGTTVTITEAGTYLLSGSLSDGMVIVDAAEDAKIQLVLNEVYLHSETSAAVYIKNADKVFLTLADGRTNELSNGGTFTDIDENSIDGVIFSKQDLTINGGGTLTVNSPGGHGIVCKDDLAITGGSYTISAASHGIDANDSIRITGETMMTITAGKDGLHAENDEDSSLGFVYLANGELTIEAEGDGISAGEDLQILDGAFQITAGGDSANGSNESSPSWGADPGSRAHREETAPTADDDSSTSMKGLKSAGSLTITGGEFTLNTADDGIHSNASITIQGGNFTIATGDDGIHADETLTITDGAIRISECYEGLEALHLDIRNGSIDLVASDDGLNAAGGIDGSGNNGGRDGRFGGEWGNFGSSEGSITISGGTLRIQASGDGIDANGSVAISGGSITIEGPIQGDTSILDYDTTAVITGGTFLGSGASGMAQTFSDAGQGVIAIRFNTQEAGSTITISDANGKTLFTAEPALAYSAIIFSSPDLLTSGSAYTVTAGTVTGKTTAQ